MCGSMVDIQSPTAQIRWKIQKRRMAAIPCWNPQSRI